MTGSNVGLFVFGLSCAGVVYAGLQMYLNGRLPPVVRNHIIDEGTGTGKARK